MDDDELRRHFAELRDADRERAPQFSHTLARPRAGGNWRTTLRLRPVALGMAAAVVVAAVWLANTPSFSPSASAPALADWRAPTDVFLQTPQRDLLNAMPALGTSVIDTMIPAPTTKGG